MREAPASKDVPAVGVDVVDPARDLEVEHRVEGVLAPVLDLGTDLQLLPASNDVGFEAAKNNDIKMLTKGPSINDVTTFEGEDESTLFMTTKYKAY